MSVKWLSFFSKQVAPFLFFILVQMTVFSTNTHATTVGDRVALLAIKSMIKDDLQGVMSSWNDSVSVCMWKGITCSSRHQRVTDLSLSFQGLVGTMSPSIGNLSFLRMIRLDNNAFSGEIPFEIGRLFRLQELRLYNNSFQGKIPASLANCSKLQVLHLGFNNLVGKIPDGLGLLSMLNLFIIHENSLKGGIPRFIGNFTFLETLSLANCGLGGRIPDTFHQLSNLRRIALAGNNLVGYVPPSLYNLSSLEQLFMDNNILTGTLPMTFGLMQPRLAVLSLSNNRFTGPLPPFVLSYPELIHLDISKNNFSGTLVITSRRACNPVIVSNDSFDGVISQCLGNTSSSPDNLDVNLIPRPIPSSICNMSNLQILDLSNNNFDGVIPHCLGNIISNLQVINLGNNHFQGTIPNVYEDCGRLEGIILKGNQLEGEVPSSLLKCQSLKVLDLGNNHLNGTFPDWLGNFPSLQVLVLKSNNFHGPVVTSSGVEFPFPSLRVLDLSQNEFVGLFSAKHLHNFRAITNVNKKNTKPEYIDAGGRYYSIVIVVKGVRQDFPQIFVDYRIIDLSHNGFEGPMPSKMSYLNSLKVLNLSHNNLNGRIPHDIGNLSQIESLDFSWNQITGPIPQSLADITTLAVLNLSENHLVGRIPDGRQFRTFEENSFGGNSGLCGFPLTKQCKDLSTPQAEDDADDDEEDESGITWQVVLLGLGCGTPLGFWMGYYMLSIGKPKWFNAIADSGEHMINLRKNKRRCMYLGI